MSEVLDAVREKYPAYKDWTDDDLAFAIGNKYPVYRNHAEFDDEFKTAVAGRSVKLAQKTTGQVLSTLQAGAEGSEMGRQQLQAERETKAQLDAYPKNADELAAQNFYAKQKAGMATEGVPKSEQIPVYTMPKDMHRTADHPQAMTIGDIADVERKLPTREGGKPIDAYDKSPEERQAEFKQGIQTPAIPLSWIKFDQKETDSLPVVAAKEISNLLVGIPEFMETPAGIFSVEAGAISGKMVRLAFAADMANSLREGSKDLVDNWKNLTTREKIRAVIDLIGSGVMATSLMHPELKSNIKAPLEVLGDRTAVLAPDVVDIAGAKLAFERKPLPSALAVAGAGAMTQLPPPVDRPQSFDLDLSKPPEGPIEQTAPAPGTPGMAPPVARPPAGPTTGRELVMPETVQPPAVQEAMAKAVEHAKSVGASFTAAALEKVAAAPAPPEKGAPDALHPEATQPVRDVRPQPGQVEKQVPAKVSGEEAGKGGGKAPAEQEVAATPKPPEPEVKPPEPAAESPKPEEIAKSLGIKFNGIQKGAGTVPDKWLFTMPVEKGGSTFGVNVGAPLEEITKRAEALKPVEKQAAPGKPVAEQAPKPVEKAPEVPKAEPEKPERLRETMRSRWGVSDIGASGYSALKKWSEASGLDLRDIEYGDVADFVKFFDTFYSAGKSGKPMPSPWANPDVAHDIYAAGRRDLETKRKRSAKEIGDESKAKAISGESAKPPSKEEADKQAERKLTDEEFEEVKQGHDEGVKQAEAGEIKTGEMAPAQEAIEKPAQPPKAPVIDEPTKPTEVKETEDELRRRAATAEGQPLEGTPRLDVREPAGTGKADVQPGEAGAASGQQVSGGPERGGQAEEAGAVRGSGVGGGPGTGGEPTGRAGELGQPTQAGAVEGAEAHPKPVVRGRPTEPADRNHELPRDAEWIPRGDKSKVRANLDAIKLLKKLEAENRNPSPAEKEVLAKYVGWGGLKSVFDEGKAAYRERKDYLYGVQATEYANWEKNWGKLYDQVKAAMTPEEWDKAAATILNAHFTSRTAINGIWDAIHRLGFNGGVALEPGTGIGNFIGLQPEPSRANTKWAAVEIDNLTARMLAKLYPEAKVQPIGFEKARLPNNSVDLVTGNFPFAKEGPHDPRYPEFSLHNYFFARAMDALKPGGILAAITSNSTMDSPSSKAARLYMAERADLIGAIRLPNNTFKENAGTEVTTDILFFRKRDGTPFKGEPFTLTTEGKTYKGEAVELNEYFQAHPEMMLGRMSLEGTMYGPKQPALLPKPGQDLAAEMKAAVDKLPQDVFGAQQMPGDKAPELGEAVDVKPGLLTVREGKPVIANPDGSFESPEWASSSAKAAQSKHYIGIRETTRRVIDRMLSADATDEEIATERESLNKQYDDYFRKYGAINDRRSKFLEDDVDFPLLMALEDSNQRIVEGFSKSGKPWQRKVTEWAKTKIFTERTIFPRNPPVRVESINDGYNVSMNFRGRVDPEWIAQLSGKTVDAVKSDLRDSGTAYENPKTGQWEPAWRYLSGPVREKLNEARRFAEENPEYKANVAALEKVQPEPIAFENINFHLGSTFIDPKAVQKFVREKLGLTGAKVDFVEKTGTWLVDPGWEGVREALNTTQYGMHGVNGHEMVRLALNLQAPTVTKLESRVSDAGKSYQAEVKDPAKTLEAEAKQQQVKDAFIEWVKQDPEAAKAIETTYNIKANGNRVPTFDPPTWTHYPNASTDITLRPHQMRVVTRMLQDSTLLAHAVGTGKTFPMITAAMEMRRLGTAKKPMLVVQNATIEQFARSFKRLYPTAKILVPSMKQRDAANRQRTMSRIATGDWDAVIIPQSFANMMPDDPVRQQAYLNDQIAEMKQALIEAKAKDGERSPKAADIQRRVKKLEKDLDELSHRPVDNVLKFEELGVDAMFVDEAHNYKKLQFNTKMDSVKGLDTGASKRGLSMLMKVRHVQEKNQGKNVIFATGTPISNTITEVWNMMRYLRPDILQQFGMEDFDSFAGNFGATRTKLEMTSVGTWDMVTRFAEYINGPELISAFRSVADVVTPEEVNLPGLPAIRGGKAQPVVVKQTPLVQNYIAQLRAELEAFKAMSGREKRENSHIPLTVFTRAKKATLDMRLIDPANPEEPGSKINVLAEKVARIYRDSEAVKGTQAIFSDLVRYTDPRTKEERWNLYQAIKDKLVAHGIPENEILIVDDSLKEAKREAAFQKLNDGGYRVAIGSTERLGTGVNFQEHAIAAHHMDAPHRPMDIEQRNGRVYRQNNQNPIIDIHSYGVENTLDASLYQRLATKQNFINQILRGDVKGRRFEDAANEMSLSFEEMMAEFSGDPLNREKVQLEHQFRTLEAQRNGHYQQVRSARDDITRLRETSIPYTEKDLAGATARKNQLARDYADLDTVPLKFGDRVFSGKKEAAKHLDERFSSLLAEAKKTAEEEFKKSEGKKATFSFKATGFKFGQQDITLEVDAQMRSQWADDAHTKIVHVPDASIRWNMKGEHWGGGVSTGNGFYSSFQSVIERLEKEPDRISGDLESKKRQLLQLESFVKQPFDRENEFKITSEKYADLLQRIQGKGKKAEVKKEVMPLGFELERPEKPLSVQRDQIRTILDRIQYLSDEQEMAPGYKATLVDSLNKRLREIESEMMKEAKPGEPAAPEPTEVTGLGGTISAEPEKKPPEAPEGGGGKPPTPPIIGMGGAIPEEYEPGKGSGTATRNAKIDEERKNRGLEPLMSRLRSPWADVWDKAMGRIDREFDVQDNLIKELQAKPRVVSDEENALLLHRKVDLKNMYERATREMVQARDDGRIDDARAINVQVNEWSEKLNEVESVLRDVGSKTGQALAARNMVVNDDFSLGALDIRMRGAKGGVPLTDTERAELIKIADEFKKENAKLSKNLADRDLTISQMEADRKLKELQEQAKKSAEPSNYVIKVAERWVADWDKRADAARARIKDRISRASAGLDPTVLLDVTEIGISHLAHIGLDFAKWSAKMIEDLGEFVKPYLTDAWEASQRIVEQKGDEEKDAEARQKIKNVILNPKPKAPPPDVTGVPKPPHPIPPRKPAPGPKVDRGPEIEKIKDRIANKVDQNKIEQIGPLVNKLARMFVEDGTTERDILIDQVHDVLMDVIPDWSRRETMDAISGYGKFTQLQKDAVSMKLRDLKAQMQQVGKLEDMAAGEAPKKSGLERGEVTDEQRRLIKQVNEMKKKSGFTVTDPATQLRSALASAKTRIENLIADLSLEIKTRERIVKEHTPIEPDPTLIRLRKELETIRAEHEKVFPKKGRQPTNEQRIAMANRVLDRAIEQIQGDLDIGKLYREKVPSKVPETPELLEKRALLEAFKAHRQELRDLANPKATPEQRALAGIKTRLANQLLEYHRRLAEGDFTPRARRVTPIDQQTSDLRVSVERVKKRVDEMVFKVQRENRATWQKGLDSFVRWERAFKLSSPVVFGKLTAAAITRVAATLTEETAGLGIGALLPKLAERAPREGGFSAKGISKALVAAINKGIDDAVKTARTGASDIDVEYGQKSIDRDWANLFGQWHGALKAPVKRAEFTYSLEKRIEHAIRNGIDPTDKLVMQRLTAEAYDDALRSIFMQRGFSSDLFNNVVGMAEKWKKYQPTGEVLARVARFMLPVVRVPINIVAETFTGVHGSATASLRTLFHVWNGTLETLDPKTADSIMRQFKKGSVGLGLMAIGYFTSGFAGGYYAGEKQKPGEPKFGGFRINGVDIPRWITHAPWFELMQIGATIRRVKNEHVKKTGEEKGLTEGMWAAALGLIEETPFVGQMLRFDKLFKPRERTQYLGELAKGTLVPGVVQRGAELLDYGKERKPTTIMEHVESGIPGARELVPEKADSKPYKPK